MTDNIIYDSTKGDSYYEWDFIVPQIRDDVEYGRSYSCLVRWADEVCKWHAQIPGSHFWGVVDTQNVPRIVIEALLDEELSKNRTEWDKKYGEKLTSCLKALQKKGVE